MAEAKPLGLFADLLQWKLASRLVVGLVVCVAAFVCIGAAVEADRPGFSYREDMTNVAAAERPAKLLLPVVFPPLLASLYVQWAMFVRRARGQ